MRPIKRRRSRLRQSRRVNRLRFEGLEPRRMLATVSWAVDSDGFWDDGSNWSTGTVPGPGDDVIIDRPAGDFTVTHRGNGVTSVGSLTSREQIVLEGSRDLRVSGDVLLEEDLDVLGQGAALHFSGELNVSGTITLQGSARILADSTSSITGDGTVLFTGSGSSAGVLAASNDSSTLTVGQNITIRGGRSRIGGSGGLINRGTIIADVPGQTMSMSFNLDESQVTNQGTISATNGSTLIIRGSWANESTITATDSTLHLGNEIREWDNNGTITVTNSIVNLDGAFDFDDLGTFNRTGGTVNLVGTLDNNEQTLELNATTGDWVLNGGRINGGSIQFTDGHALTNDTGQGGVFSGVTLNSDMTLDRSLQITGGLTLNSTMTLSASSGRLLSGSTQAIDGTGTIEFQPGTSTQQTLLSVSSGSTLTIGPDVTLRGGRARLGGSGTLINNGTIIADIDGDSILVGTNVDESHFINRGTLSAINGSALSLSGRWENETSIAATDSTLTLGSTRFGWENRGTITANGSIVNLDGAFESDDLGTFNRTGGTVNLVGTLDNNQRTLELNATTGDWVLNGGRINGGTIQFVDGHNLTNGSQFGGVFSGVTLDSDMTLDGSLRITGGLTLNSTLTLSASVGRLLSGSNQTIDGTGTIIFANGVQTPDTLLTAELGSTLTLGEDLTVRGGRVRIGGSGSLINLGTIIADVPGERVTISLNLDSSHFLNRGSVTVVNGASVALLGAWTNESTITATDSTLTLGSTNFSWDNDGTITADGSTVNLAGAFTQQQLGDFRRSGGTVNLTGTLYNRGQTLEINSITGDWTLDGGRINGGTINLLDDRTIHFANNITTSRLSGVTLNGDVELSESAARLNISGGLTLNGEIKLSGFRARLVSDSTQTIDGDATIVFRGNEGGSSRRLIVLGSTELTLGDRVTIRGENYRLGIDSTTGSIISHGRILADTSGGLVRIESASNNVAPFTNNGTLAAIDGTLRVSNLSGELGIASAVNGVLELGRDTFVGVEDSLTSFPNGTVSVTGNLTGDNTEPARFDVAGTLRFSGSGSEGTPQLLEVMSEDRGEGSVGFEDNFDFGGIVVQRNTFVRLVDDSDNSAGNAPEAVYAGSLIVENDSTLDLAGLNLYVRAAQIDGTVIGGDIIEVPESGALTFGVPTQGAISVESEIDSWQFFAREDQTIAVLVNPSNSGELGAPAPHLEAVQFELVDESGSVLATRASTGDNTGASEIVTLIDFLVPTDGTYTVRVQAGPDGSDSIGNYLITAYDVKHDRGALSINNTTLGAIETPLSTDSWIFNAVSGTQVRFDLVDQSGSSVIFDLVGPNEYEGFVDQVDDSQFIVLPENGQYEIVARGSGLQYGGTYSFRLDQTPQADLTLGVPLAGDFVGSGQAQLYRFEAIDTSSLTVELDDLSSLNQNELYVKFGSPPTRGDFDFHASIEPTSDQQITIPQAAPGTWFVLVYSDATPQPGSFTILADTFDVRIDEVLPSQHGDAVDAVLTIRGVGFDSSTQFNLIADNGSVHPPATFSVDSFFQATATFAAGEVPVGTYTLRAELGDGSFSDLQEAIEITTGGTADLEVDLILPAAVGRSGIATAYVQYANVGSVAMPAPLLLLRATDQALLTLDESRLVSGFWTSSNPSGFSDEISILASGDSVGLLNPGESVRVPVHYIGLEQPWDLNDFEIDFDLTIVSSETDELIDWDAMKEPFRPQTISSAAWDIVYENLQVQVGDTWGDFYETLLENRRYLDRLGRYNTNQEELIQFEVFQAMGLSVQPELSSVVDLQVDAPGIPIVLARDIAATLETRHNLGTLGYGWQWNGGWQRELTVQSDGGVIITDAGGRSARYQPDSRRFRGYFSEAGNPMVLRGLGSDQFELISPDQSKAVFGSNGRVQFIEDPNGNRITATWEDVQLARLEHSAGQFVDLEYENGRVQQLTDSAGRTVSYEYALSGNHLASVTGVGGQVTRYRYHDGTVPAHQHALQSIENPDGTRSLYTYDARGRLASDSLGDDAERILFSYDSTGTVLATNELGETVKFFFDHDARITGYENGLGHRSLVDFDESGNLTRFLDPQGHAFSFQYDRLGNLIHSIDPLRRTNEYFYEPGTNRILRSVDAR